MRQEDLSNLKSLFEQAEFASTKSDAAKSVKQLEFACSTLKLDPYPRTKLSEAINYAKQASGQVKDKEHWVSCMKDAWNSFEREVKVYGPK